jgi:hypothetical protein
LQDATLSGGTGLLWNVSTNDGSIAMLTMQHPLDLRTVPQPMLRFDSLLALSHSIAQLEVSTDGQMWQPVLSLQPSAGWQSIHVNLSAFQQQVVWLRWIWMSQVPAAGQMADFWSVDNIIVADASLLQPTPTPTIALIVPSTPPATTETATATVTPEATEEPSLTTAEPTLVMPTETPVPTVVVPEVTPESLPEETASPAA